VASNYFSEPPSELHLWAGFECTVARLGDRYVDQLELSGHASRLDDLNMLAELGARAVRYPVIWERTAPAHIEDADWTWSDERLSRLRTLGIEPIVGLVHHGSGPPDTSLIDPQFPERVAHYARAVAERYPWIQGWTPINEPLTTARFSGLYGHWYPHGCDYRTFLRALLNQCRAVVLAMEEIRAVNPDAQLVQTDDLGKAFGTDVLQYQVDFENERRWLSFDLLCGRLSENHPLWSFVVDHGVTPDELEWFQEHACPPNILGINHYLSSERFLDDRLDRYPPDAWGGNGQHEYADVLAARVLSLGPAGPRTLLGEAWDRYGIPLAITEAHNGCTREEQIRWLMEIWTAAEDARHAGIDMRAVTAWSLLGAFDWDTLLTQPAESYEPGVFDLRGPRPRPTAAFHVLQTLATGGIPDHPVLDVPGWWRRPERLLYGVSVELAACAPDVGVTSRSAASSEERKGVERPARELVITGATGTLGRAFARSCEARGLPYRLLSRQDMDIARASSVQAVLRNLRPLGGDQHCGIRPGGRCRE
jgi:dTDP-4-dehydrorhamnose reductase